MFGTRYAIIYPECNSLAVAQEMLHLYYTRARFREQAA